MWLVLRLSAARVLLAMTLVFLAGCGSLRSRHTLPEEYADAAMTVEGLRNVRAWGDQPNDSFRLDLMESIKRTEGDLEVLALSGGGPNGAFGAGLLNGWTEAGDRPQFRVVTGTSAGALISPFAFLGSAYDDELKEAFTTISDDNILTPHNLISFLRSWESIADTKPLYDLVRNMITDKMIRAVAEEHRQGRRLYVGTTHLDANRPVIWNLGAIAASGHANAHKLFRRVLVASAAIPVVFPPVYFNVETAAGRFDEMHVDGGVSAQVFGYDYLLGQMGGHGLRMDPSMKVTTNDARIYIIRNGQFENDWEDVKPRVIEIAKRSTLGLTRAQSIGDLYRIFTFAQRDGVRFNLAYIPDSFVYTDKRDGEFDTAYMNALFVVGEEMGRRPDKWLHGPPNYNTIRFDLLAARTRGKDGKRPRYEFAIKPDQGLVRLVDEDGQTYTGRLQEISRGSYDYGLTKVEYEVTAAGTFTGDIIGQLTTGIMKRGARDRILTAYLQAELRSDGELVDEVKLKFP